MITLNGKKFALNKAEFDGGDCVGFYKPYKHVINLLNPQRFKVGVISPNCVLGLATKLSCGRWWYTYGDIELVGPYDCYAHKIVEVVRALEYCGIKYRRT